MKYNPNTFFQGDKLYINCDTCKEDKGVLEITGDRIVYGKFECDDCILKRLGRK